MKRERLIISRASNGWVVETYTSPVLADQTMVFEHRYGLGNFVDHWVAKIEDQDAIEPTEQLDNG